MRDFIRAATREAHNGEEGRRSYCRSVVENVRQVSPFVKHGARTGQNLDLVHEWNPFAQLGGRNLSPTPP